jgi:hypothetical protein
LEQLVREIALVEIEVELAIDDFGLWVTKCSEEGKEGLKVVDNSLLHVLWPIICFGLICGADVVEQRDKTNQVNAL